MHSFYLCVVRFASIVWLMWPVALLAADYYVSPTGEDKPTGGGPADPWKTIGYALGRVGPGDTVHLEAGAAFPENVYFGSGGTAGAPLTLVSDAANCATIQQVNAASEGVLIWNAGYITLENLVVTGLGTNLTAKAGVAAMTDNGQHAGLTFRHVTVSGFRDGFYVFGWGGAAYGLNTVSLDNCHAHHNLNCGGQTWAEGVGGISNVVVRGCRFNDNYGNPAATGNTGSGFIFGRTRDGLIEHCIAHDNGGWGVATEGPVGLWAYDSAKITIQFCEAYRNQAKNMDGGGFDLDQNVTDSVIKYCYAYSNYGAGFLLCNGDTGAWTNNTVRYCISDNDGTGGKMAGLHFYSASSTGLKNSRIYGNTICNGVSHAVWFQSFTGMAGLTLRNNLFVTANNKKLVNGSPTTAQALFQGNDYWPSGGTFDVAGYSSLAAWRSATGQEMLDSAPVGLQVNPLLNADYRLLADSPLIDAGLDLPARFGIDPGQIDYFSNAIPRGATFDIGAHDSMPTVRIAADDPEASEFGADPGMFSVSRTGGSITGLTVQYALGGTALNGTDYSNLLTSVTITPGNTNATISIAPMPDAWAEGDETVSATLASNSLYLIGALATGIVTIHDLPVDAWRFQHFAGNPPGSADSEDPDGDGLANLLEYALSLDPLAINAGPEPSIENDYLTLTYTRTNPHPPDVAYAGGVSPDLADWCFDPACTVTQTTVNGNTATVRVRDTVPVSSTEKRFLRLRITR